MIIVTVLRTHAAATVTEVLTAGRVGMEAKFHFSSEWDGLGKTAVFEAGGETRDVIVDPDGILVPPECMIAGADLRVGVYGYDESGEIVIPTIYALVGQVQRGADPSGDESYPPTPDVGEQAVAAASKALEAAAAAQEVAADIQRRADAGEFDGAPGYTPVKGKDYFDGAPGKDGEDYVLTEADKVEIAEIAADLVDVPESGGSADLTGYATEEWVKKGYQPKGDYAARSEIPTVPTKLSAFTNDAGFVTEDALENVGGKAYVQDTEPAQMEVGEFWYNPDEETEGIPTTLPNPHKLTFSGAVNAEYDGSEAVEVVIPQGGGGGDSYRLVVDTTVEEDVANIVFTEDIDGNPLSLRKFIFNVEFKAASGNAAASFGIASYTPKGEPHVDAWYGMKKLSYGTSAKDWWGEFCLNIEKNGDCAVLFKRAINVVYSNDALNSDGGTYHRQSRKNGNYNFHETIDRIELYSGSAKVMIPAGTTVKIWGVDA